MAGQNEVAAFRRIEQQRIIGEKALATRSETRRQRRFAAPRLAEKRDCAMPCVDCAGVKDNTPLLAQRQRQHLVQVQVLHGAFGYSGNGPGADSAAIGRNIEIAQTRETHKVILIDPVELRPLRAIRKYPFVER